MYFAHKAYGALRNRKARFLRLSLLPTQQSIVDLLRRKRHVFRAFHGTLNGLRAKKQANNRRSGKQSKQHAARTHGRPLLFSCDRFRIHSMYGKAFRRPLQGGED